MGSSSIDINIEDMFVEPNLWERFNVKGNPSKGSYDQLTVDTLLEYKRLTSLNRASKKMAISMAKAFYEERSQPTDWITVHTKPYARRWFRVL